MRNIFLAVLTIMVTASTAVALPFSHEGHKRYYDFECFVSGKNSVSGPYTNYKGAKFLNDWCDVNGPGHYPEIQLEIQPTTIMDSLRKTTQKYDYRILHNGVEVANHHRTWTWVLERKFPTIIMNMVDGTTRNVVNNNGGGNGNGNGGSGGNGSGGNGSGGNGNGGGSGGNGNGGGGNQNCGGAGNCGNGGGGGGGNGTGNEGGNN